MKISWSNIAGEMGYEISKTTSKTKKTVVATISSTTAKSKVLKVTKGKTYYYRVRAYKLVGTKKIYTPWSSAKSYKLK